MGSHGACPKLSNISDSNNSHKSMAKKRSLLACERCYKKKVKCEIGSPSGTCLQCVRQNVKCRFITRKEKQEAVKRTQYIKVLEERLEKMENLLRTAGISDEAAATRGGYDSLNQKRPEFEAGASCDGYRTASVPGLYEGQDIGQQSPPLLGYNQARRASAKLASSNSDTSPDRRHCPKSPLSDDGPQQVSVFKSDHREESRYYGRASSLSILSHEGVQWIKAKTGDTEFLNFMFSHSANDYPWDHWRADIFHDLFSSQVYKPLPPRAEVFSLIKDYFQSYNRFFPLYDEPSFMRLVQWQYTQQTCNDAAWWASINIILALAYEYRNSDNLKLEKNREKAWFYFKNAMSVFPELALRRTDLLSLQALLGLASFLRSRSGTRAAMPIITAAMKCCHRLGLHRDVPRPHMPQNDLEQRRRVFWIAYILDQSTCVRAGSAPAQSVDDFDVDLPEVNDGSTVFFRKICSLSVIKSRIYDKLYSTRALQRTPEEVCQVVNELYKELEEWRDANPIDKSHLGQVGDSSFLADFASVGLKVVYYNCQIMIHRMPLVIYFYACSIEGKLGDRFDPVRLDGQWQTSALICVQAARETLQLVNSMPWADIAWILSLLYYVFLAVMTIFVSILRDSQHPRAREDLQLLSIATTFFASIVSSNWLCYYSKFMARMCSNFERIARAVIEKERKLVKLRAGDNPVRLLSRRQITQAAMHISSTAAEPRTCSSGDGYPGSSLGHAASEGVSVSATLSSAPWGYQASASHAATSSSLGPHAGSETPATTGTMSSTPWPDLWQIPLTADWEFGGQLFGELLPNGLNYQLVSNSGNEQLFASNSTMAAAAVASPLGYFFGPADPGLQQNGQMWTGGFSGPTV